MPDQASIHAEDMRAKAQWRMLSWRTGTKGPLKASFGAIRVRIADGAPQRIGDKGQQHMPGEEAWLVGERRISAERKYYPANLPARRSENVRRYDQGALDLRTGASTTGNSVSINSRADHGRVFTDMRS